MNIKPRINERIDRKEIDLTKSEAEDIEILNIAYLKPVHMERGTIKTDGVLHTINSIYEMSKQMEKN